MLHTDDYRRTALPRVRPLPSGADAAMLRLTGCLRRGIWVRRRLEQLADQAVAEFVKLEHCGSRELARRIEETSARVGRGGSPAPETLKEGLALVAEVAARELGLRAHPVQMLGAFILLNGGLAEMATGEGKTLTVGLAAAVAAWNRRPCHVVTANDYLAERDASWLRPFFKQCGLTSGCVTGEMTPPDRRANHGCDVTYTTSKELLADFLRDRLLLGKLADASRRHLRYFHAPERMAQLGLVLRGLHTAFVDEADNLLIDEAVTPLIISRQEENDPLLQACLDAHQLAQHFQPERDYTKDLTLQSVEFTPAGLQRLETDCGASSAFQGIAWRKDLVSQALKAREFFHRNRQYVVDDGQIVIVDESTGRLMYQRTWRHGLHQAVEAKEGLTVTHPTETMARMSFQRFFRMFRRLAGLTGTGREAASEFWFVYGLPVFSVRTHRPVIRREDADFISPNEKEKWEAVVAEVIRVHETGRPVLVGTRSVLASEQLSQMLAARGIACQVLNALRHREEAHIVAQAGKEFAVTVATNMAGRGTDISLTAKSRELGGLHVIATERHLSRRIDRQLFGRAGRQGDPGSARAFVSCEDDLLVRFLPSAMRRSLATYVAARGSHAGSTIAGTAVRHAQNRAERIAFSQRKAVMQMDTWFDEALSFANASGTF